MEFLGAPRPGEWRAIYDEPEQRFEDYAAGPRPRTRPRIGLVPLGELDAARLEPLRRYAEVFFQTDAVLLPRAPLFHAAQVPARGQFDASILIEELIARRPDEALLVLGIAACDVFSRDRAYVFGESRRAARTAVVSLARLDSLLRAIRVVSHEIGHLLGLAHCVKRPCLMQGSNTIEEADGQPLEVCPEDYRKLEWALDLDRGARARALAAFHRDTSGG